MALKFCIARRSFSIVELRFLHTIVQAFCSE